MLKDNYYVCTYSKQNKFLITKFIVVLLRNSQIKCLQEHFL